MHEAYAERARELGDDGLAKRAEERAERARERLRLALPSAPGNEWNDAPAVGT